ncbi:MAG: mersacidin/lichenicidin family type 2 lantibiotic [Alphaproteobacteria bacterium]|nr:mersacidin/lichenicidin family type 2 lantibiotic [Alphaproteobacteria bacterium]MCB9698655.1 mersacidin/lichenicidin family type 2 lantibiotic [Alphaproteobacteria bacterium]
MNKKNLAAALKNPELRAGLSDAELAEIEAPVGAIELTDAELGEVQGGATYLSWCRTVCGVYCTITRDFNCLST